MDFFLSDFHVTYQQYPFILLQAASLAVCYPPFWPPLVSHQRFLSHKCVWYWASLPIHNGREEADQQSPETIGKKPLWTSTTAIVWVEMDGGAGAYLLSCSKVRGGKNLRSAQRRILSPRSLWLLLFPPLWDRWMTDVFMSMITNTMLAHCFLAARLNNRYPQRLCACVIYSISVLLWHIVTLPKKACVIGGQIYTHDTGWE